MKKTGKIISWTSIGVIAVVVVVVNVLCLSTFSSQIQNLLIGGGTASDATLEENRETGEALAEDIMEEGAVLVKNDNDSLPLAKTTENAKINVFGWSSTKWIGGGSGSGRVVSSMMNYEVTTDFLTALSDYSYEAVDAEGNTTTVSVEYNTELTEMYQNYCSSRPAFTSGTLNSYDYEFHRIIEPDINDSSLYKEELLSNALDFSSTAIVVIGRMSGESSDAPKVQYKGNSASSTVDDASRTYLEISTEEEDLLTYVGANYENVIVLINSTNTMELGFLNTIPGLDSCLVVGGTGINAVTGVVNLLYGDETPSGKLADTYAYDLSTAASYANSGIDGINQYSNISSSQGYYPYDGTTTQGNLGHSGVYYPGLSYVDYVEDIYIGYKWYETADAEGFWDSDFAENLWGITNGYDDVVQYPFGYGLSYTTFDWEVVGLSHDAGANLAKDDTIKIDVRVTNTGDVAGKDVVELYYSAPYEDGGIEKSAINLIDFEKTPLLEPEQSVTLTLSLDVEDMASYDCYDKNENGITSWELDAGSYTLSLRSDSHNLHEIATGYSGSVYDQAEITYNVESTYIYDTDSYSGAEVDNLFTGDDCTDVASIDGSNSGADITYMTRSDFISTFPKSLESAREINSIGLTYNLWSNSLATSWVNSENVERQTTGSTATDYLLYDPNNEYAITDLGLELGANYDDERWDDVVDQLTYSELENLVLHGYVKTSAASSIGKPVLNDVDGPAQFGSFNRANVGVGFPNATVLAQTWSKSLAYDFGEAMGEIARGLGYDGWYGPGMNTHRSPFGGRNYEYYSEDPILSGYMGAESVRGAKNKGVYSYLKHLAVYDQDSYRDGLYTWLTEQSFREIYLKPFKMSIQDGGATGIMTSYNRLGGVWAGGSKALLTELLREEWGFKGTVLTDYSDHWDYMNVDHMLFAGGDLWMDGWGDNGTWQYSSGLTNSDVYIKALKDAVKNILYTGVNAIYTAANPIGDDVESYVIGGRYSDNTTWKIAFYVVDVVIVAGLGVWVYFLVRKPKNRVKTTNTEQTAD